MAATVIINEWTAAQTHTDKTAGTVRFKNANNSTVDLVNPLVVPASAAFEVSFEKWLRLQITDAGGFTQIDNLEAYTDGEALFHAGSPTEIDVFYATTGVFETPAEPAAVDPPQSSLVGSPLEDMTALFTRDTGNRINMDAINTGPFTDGSPAEHIGDFLVLVMLVRGGAPQGVTSSETLTFSFDEI